MVINHMGLVLQPTKQMFGQTVGEFLRVLFQNGTASGYLIRSMANLILEEVQSPIYHGAEEMCATSSDSVTTLAR